MEKFKSVGIRFLKGMISGAVTAMSLITLAVPTAWSDFKPIIGMLTIAAAFGALNGFLLAAQKYLSWQE